METRRAKHLEFDIVDCLDEIAAIPTEFMASTSTANVMGLLPYSGFFDPWHQHTPLAQQKYMPLVSPLRALLCQTSRRLGPTPNWYGESSESKDGYHTKHLVWKIDWNLYRVQVRNGWGRPTWSLERLTTDNQAQETWITVDEYSDSTWRVDGQKVARAWNKRRLQAMREVAGQTKEEAKEHKKSKKAIAITNQKMATVLHASELRDSLEAYIKAVENGTVTQEMCADLYEDCMIMQSAQKKLRKVMGTKMPRSSDEG